MFAWNPAGIVQTSKSIQGFRLNLTTLRVMPLAFASFNLRAARVWRRFNFGRNTLILHFKVDASHYITVNQAIWAPTCVHLLLRLGRLPTEGQSTKSSMNISSPLWLALYFFITTMLPIVCSKTILWTRRYLSSLDSRQPHKDLRSMGDKLTSGWQWPLEDSSAVQHTVFSLDKEDSERPYYSSLCLSQGSRSSFGFSLTLLNITV
jgi:hypothetical protein